MILLLLACTDTVTVALISSSGTLAVAITALLLNYRLFNSLERRIEVIEADLKWVREKFHEIGITLLRLENKIDHVNDTVARHDAKLEDKQS